MKFGGTVFSDIIIVTLVTQGLPSSFPAILLCKFTINVPTRSSLVLKTKDSIVSFVTNLRNKNQKQWIGDLNEV